MARVDATLRPVGYGQNSPNTLTKRREIQIWRSGHYHGYNEGLSAAIDLVIEGVLNDEPLIMSQIGQTLEAHRKLKALV